MAACLLEDAAHGKAYTIEPVRTVRNRVVTTAVQICIVKYPVLPSQCCCGLSAGKWIKAVGGCNCVRVSNAKTSWTGD